MDEIEKAIAAIRAQGGTEAEVQRYLASIGAQEVTPDGPSERERAARARARQAQNEEERKALNTASTSFVNLLDAGTFGLAGLATDALSPGSFRANRDARRTIYESIPAGERAALGLAGGLANPMNRVPFLGTGATTTARTIGRGAVTGATMGAAQGVGENVGTTDGATRPALEMAAGGLLLGGALAPLASRVARVGPGRFFDPLTQHLPGGGAAKTRMASEAIEDAVVGRAAAASRADARMGDARMRGRGDAAGGMDIDTAGPTMLAHARGATGTVPGREAFRGPFEARERGLLADLTTGRPNAPAIENELRAARKAQATADYDAAVEATKGQPIESPSLDRFKQSPTGRAVWQEVQRQREDFLAGTNDPSRALPEVTRRTDPAPMVEGLETFGARGYEETQRVPDAEAIHLMTRWLRDRSKTAPGQVFPDGVSAEAAGNALTLLERAKEELPLPFRLANERYATASREIDAIQLGRTPWRSNPKPGKRSKPLEDVLGRMAGMTPEELALLRQGKQFDLASRVDNARLSPRKATEAMARPQSDLAQELAVAGGELPARLRAADDILERQRAVLPSGLLSLEPGGGGVVTQAAENMRPSLFWTAQKYVRDVLGQGAEQTLAKRGAEDAAFARLLTGPPGTTKRAIAKHTVRGRKGAAAARGAAAVAGRAGLLDKY